MKNNLASGFVLASVLLLCVSAQKVYQTIRVEVAGIPHAGKLIRLTELNVPYTVPAAHALVITGIGIAEPQSLGEAVYCKGTVTVDDIPALFFTGGYWQGAVHDPGPCFQSLGTGYFVAPGQIVDIPDLGASAAGKIYVVGYTERD
jgi:hypothetical protein